MAVLAFVDLTSRQKAAVVVSFLGSKAEPLLKSLAKGEMELLAEEILMLGEVPDHVRDEVLTEFQNNMAARQAKSVSGLERASQMLEATLGEAEAIQVVDRISWRSNDELVAYVKKNPKRFADLVAVEHPQTISFLLTQIDSEIAGKVVPLLPDEVQPDIAWRIAIMKEIDPITASQVHKVLGEVIAPKEGETKRMEALGGEQLTAGLLNMIPVSTQKLVMEEMESKDADLTARVRKLMFVFRDILLLDDKSMQRVLKEVDLKDLSLALMNTEEDITDLIYRNVSERAAQSIKEEMEYMSNVKKEEINEARDRIIDGIRALEEQGEVVIERGSGDEE